MCITKTFNNVELKGDKKAIIENVAKHMVNRWFCAKMINDIVCAESDDSQQELFDTVPAKEK